MSVGIVVPGWYGIEVPYLVWYHSIPYIQSVQYISTCRTVGVYTYIVGNLTNVCMLALFRQPAGTFWFVDSDVLTHLSMCSLLKRMVQKFAKEGPRQRKFV